MTQGIITISETVNIYPRVLRGKVVSYMIQRSTELVEQEVELSPSEFNALAAHAPVVKAQTAALRDALDWIEDNPTQEWSIRYNRERSRAIEAGHAALQAVEDVKE